jgi:formylglycine-generating enzyme required for sulfatase activity
MRYTLLLSLTLLLSCVETSSLVVPTAPTSKAGATEQFPDLEAEYASFSTQALTFNYITRKVHHWIRSNNGEGMRREIAFARFKHPQLFKNAIKTSESICLQTLGFPEVDAYKGLNPDFEAYTHGFICVPPRGNYTNALGMGFNTLPAGSFTMGSDSLEFSNERPPHEVQRSGPVASSDGQWQLAGLSPR